MKVYDILQELAVELSGSATKTINLGNPGFNSVR